jgi:taurine dioxygenase
VHVTGQQPRGEHQDELLEPHRDFEWSTTTPIALPHQRTGRTVLYVSEMMTREIVGLPPM